MWDSTDNVTYNAECPLTVLFDSGLHRLDLADDDAVN